MDDFHSIGVAGATVATSSQILDGLDEVTVSLAQLSELFLQMTNGHVNLRQIDS